MEKQQQRRTTQFQKINIALELIINKQTVVKQIILIKKKNIKKL